MPGSFDGHSSECRTIPGLPGAVQHSTSSRAYEEHACSFLLRRLDRLFTTISGHLDSVAALKKLAEETRESDCKKVKLSKKRHEDTLESIIGLICTSVDAREVMISEQRKQTEAFVLEARAAREEAHAAREEAHAARLASDEIVKSLIDVLRQGLLG
ncbi:hypothetical protein BU17DRAFT_101172 [Hysterangium stoloniferum]|nr:hypothetical protein BU17DRAFT_101172 [Hysterangium stoloniferum]